jgi:hypothetical protein
LRFEKSEATPLGILQFCANQARHFREALSPRFNQKAAA